MSEEKLKSNIPHSLILDNRRSISVIGVSDVDSFDEQTVVAYTSIGILTIKGENLHINSLNVDTGDLSIEGKINSIYYSENQSNSGKNLFSKFFK